LHISPADSAPTAAGDRKDVQNAQSELEPEPTDSAPTEVKDLKYVQNAQSELEPELTDGLSPVHRHPVVSLSEAESGPRNLWDEAYNTLREKEPELINAYEKDLLASQDQYPQGMLVRLAFLLVERHQILCLTITSTCTEWEHTNIDASIKRELADEGDKPKEEVVDREEQLQQLVNRKLEDMQNSQLRITVGGKEVVVKEVVGKIVRTVISAKSFISSVVSAEPHAALAWAGVLAVLPVSIYIAYCSAFKC
jgi:hypothetical protein